MRVHNNSVFSSKYDLPNENTLCNICNSNNLIIIKSKTNSIYQYCDSCKSSKNISLKHYYLDNLLLEIKNSIQCLSKNILLNLTIEIFKSNNSIDLFINNVKVSNTEFISELSKKDCYYIKNTIHYLINDYTDISYVDTQIKNN